MTYTFYKLIFSQPEIKSSSVITLFLWVSIRFVSRIHKRKIVHRFILSYSCLKSFSLRIFTFYNLSFEILIRYEIS